jgi:methyl-accepting chemotaxis protein
MTITKKLCVASLTTLGIILLLAFSSVFSVNRMGQSLDTALHSSVSKAELAGGIRYAFESLKAESTSTQIAYVIDLLEAGAKGHNSQAVDGVACSGCHGTDSVEGHRKKFEEIVASTREGISRFRGLAETGAEQTALTVFADRLTTWSGLYEEYVNQAGHGNFGRGHQILTQQMFPIMGEIDKAVGQLADNQHRDLVAAAAAAGRTTAASRWSALVSGALGICAGLAILLLARHVGKVLRQVAARLGASTEQVATSAAEVFASSQSLADGASQQATALAQTSASMAAMADATHRNRDHSRSAADVVVESGQVVGKMEDTVRGMSASMHEIRVSGDKIVAVVKLIDGIAFQTRILALNAAVEAARAGSSGSGFAVVADEVGRLAQQSAEAAKTTAELVDGTVSGVREGAARLQGVAEAIGLVTGNSSKVGALVSQVLSGSEEQARNIDQVSAAVARMEQVTQQTATTAQAAASASRELDSRAAQLCNAAEQLRSLIGRDEAAA